MAERNDEEQTSQATEPEDTAAITASDAADATTEESTGGAASAPADWAAQLRAARQEADQYKDKFLRERAEMENFRKRQERLAGERNQRYKRDLMDKVLEVMDNLDRAMHFEETMDREDLHKGLRMVHWQLEELLKTEGLTPVPAAAGEPFDPHLHEAMDSVPSAEHPEGTIVEEVRKGYMLGGDLLRPARVRVSAGATKE